MGVDEVLAMARAGTLDLGQPVELLEGELVPMSPQTARHAGVSAALARMLARAAGAGLHVRTHSPVLLSATSLPEPDVALVRGEPEQLLDRHPSPEDLLLVVEVTHSSRRRDLNKIGLYAGAGVAEYWILDLDAQTVDVFRSPRGETYAERRQLAGGGTLSVPGTDAVLELGGLFRPARDA